MEQKLTHYQTLGLQDVVEIGGDLLLLPAQHSLPREEVRALREGKTLAIGESMLGEMVERYNPLYEEYQAQRGIYGSEPDWMNEKPMAVRARLRFDYALKEEDSLAIMNVYPHTGLSYMVRNGGLCEDLCRTFNLFRLDGVLQLGYLQAPWFQDQLYPQPIAQHNRFIHSLDVMTISSVIGHNVGLAGGRFNTLRAGALTHDMGTPAGGDSVKLVDMDAFDEDVNYPQLAARYDWEPLRAKYQINERQLYETILNRGVLGQILDIADKLAYVARDLHACDPYLHFGRDHLDQHGLHTLLELLERYPNVCALWDSIAVHDGQMVFLDPARLCAFLKVRVLLFRELYYHPNARFGEYLVSRVLVKALYDSGKLTRAELLDMRDYELNKRLNEEFGHGRNTMAGHTLVEDIAAVGTQRKTFSTRAEAEAFIAARHYTQGNPFALLEDTTRGIKPGTHFKVMTEDGPQPFAYAYPGDTQELEEMAQLYPSVHVYYLEHAPDIPPEKLSLLTTAFAATAP